MAFATIDNFLQQGLQYNGARPSRFMCNLTLPNVVSGYTGASEKFTYTCRAASIPSFDVGVVSVGYMGRVLKFSGDRVWNNWKTTVILDQDYITRTMFEAWSNGIDALDQNVMDPTASYTNYKATMDIYHLGQDDSVLAQYTLTGIWPSSVGPISLSWNQTNAISEFDVDFAFDNCKLSSGNQISGLPVYSV